MTQLLQGKHALVTGGGGGIGTAIAIALAALGAKVTLVGRDREKLERAATSAKGARFASVIAKDGSPIATSMRGWEGSSLAKASENVRSRA